MSVSDTPAYAIDAVNRVKRRHDRGFYDHETVHRLLDAAALCHVSYVIDGQPYCTPTLFWREGTRLYWHGSSASRMLRNQSHGEPACLTVAHLDSLVMARCGFNHSVNYRSVMAYGTASIVDDLDEKHKLIDAFLDRFFPGRAATMRPATVQEVKATTFIRMPIDEASAKVRNMHIADDEEDYAWPAWTALYPVKQVIGAAEECPRQLPGVTRPEGMKGWTEGRKLDDIMLEMYREHYET